MVRNMISKYRLVYLGIVYLLLLAFTLTGCTQGDDFKFITPENYDDAKFEALLEALKDGDVDTIYMMFTKEARTIVGEEKLKDDIEYVCTVIKGKIESYEVKRSIRSSMKWESGLVEIPRVMLNTVTTTEGEYVIHYMDYIVNTLHPKRVGIDVLLVMSIEEYKKIGMFRGDFCGAYRPVSYDESDVRAHEYNMDFGTFVLPAGYYFSESASNDSQMVFGLNGVDVSALICELFSLECIHTDSSLSNIDELRAEILNELNNTPNIAGVYDVFDDGVSITQNGYCLLKYHLAHGSHPKQEDYYILHNSENKYIHICLALRDNASEEVFKPYETAVEELIDSFVWAEDE